MPTTRHIDLRAQAEGLHHWPDATDPDTYLRDPHRHLFVVIVEVQVFHDDREIEINAAARWLTELLPTLGHAAHLANAPVDFGPQSCEHLATRITEAVKDRYGAHRQVRTSVLEDGHLGATVRWEPDATTDPAP